MSFTADVPTPLLPQPLPKRGHPIVAWLVIIAAVVVAAGYEGFASHLSDQVAVKIKANSDRAYLSELQIQGKAIVGLAHGFDQSIETVDPQIQEGLTHGPYEQRLRFVILAGEMHGPATALEKLATMREVDWEKHPPTPEEKQLTELVEKLYRTQLWSRAVAVAGGSVGEAIVEKNQEQQEPSDLSLNDTERQELRDKLDWFGDLALATADGSDPVARAAVLAAARRTAMTELLVAMAVFLLAGLGLWLLFFGILLLLIRYLRFRFQRGSREGGIYAETFALWMVVYMGLEVAVIFVPAGSSRMLLAGLFGLSSLLTLGWPVVRGVSWRRVRQDLGWWTSGPVILEMGWGLASYLASMPLLIGGVLLSGGLLRLYKRIVGDDPFAIPPQATHPVQEMLAHGSWWQCVQIFLVAAVFAPVIEETMFRGVLYRHLRELGDQWPRVVSVVFSMFTASFVFAVIHPQGFLGVPVLMALAVGFTFTRELRGSLVGSITAHSLNNAVVTLVAISIS